MSEISSKCKISKTGGCVAIINEKENANKRFKSFINGHKYVICLYHWLSCGFCVSFVDIWNKVIAKFKDDINVVSIELEAIKNLDKKYQVTAFPTIVIFKDGKKHIEFTKTRSEKELSKFIKENMLQKK